MKRKSDGWNADRTNFYESAGVFTRSEDHNEIVKIIAKLFSLHLEPGKLTSRRQPTEDSILWIWSRDFVMAKLKLSRKECGEHHIHDAAIGIGIPIVWESGSMSLLITKKSHRSTERYLKGKLK